MESDGGPVEVLAVVPRSEADVDLEQMDGLPSGPEVNIVDDFELDKSGAAVVSVGDASKITFYTNCLLPNLVLHFWSSDRFFSWSVVLVDDKRISRTFTMSNKRSIITVDKNECSLPIENGEGWQRVNLDLDSLLRNAFGTSFVACFEVTVSGSCKLARLFFQAKDYSDVELPKYLRVFQHQA